ncbi:sigma factor G inhibitor Gin [Alicyclobacillus fastidiosus]|uniref:Sigma factor G inhibitor Gin n=1 Tax=Alicyclobacillus fastidiosus TaxID=392011 RepID=A0ABV5AE90_9BACL|nr:sigma factor G inhibitor Gin [Alicyclobacillus fastidiosus]WEH09907.1 sigma factor G inhibitor Gin [Alicyclobacillus fastidiosus]
MGTHPKEISSCIICHQGKDQGIRICGQFICSDCERDIVNSDVRDEHYQHYVNEMKRIWLSALTLGH